MRQIRFLLSLLIFAWALPAAAAVEIHFYSKDFASSFPHGFVRLTGHVDSTGEQVDTNYGFTPTSLSPAILMGSVKGMIETVDPVYVSRSIEHFSLKLTDAQYAQVLAVVEKWRSRPQPSYRLNGRNCVDFVADVATTLGLSAPRVPALMKKPKSYLQKVTRDNAALIARWRQEPSLPIPSTDEVATAKIAPLPSPAVVTAPPPVPAQ